MNATAPFATLHPRVAAETSQSALEVLGIVAAVIGVLLWVAGLAWFVVSDVFRAAHHYHKHGPAGTHRDSDRHIK